MNIYGRSPRGIVIILLSYSIFTLVFLLPVLLAYPVLTWMTIIATISLIIVLIYLIITVGPIKLLLDKIYETAHKRRKFSFIKGNKTIRKAFAQLEDIAETLQTTEDKLSHEKSGISAGEKMFQFNAEVKEVIVNIENAVKYYTALVTSAENSLEYFPGYPPMWMISTFTFSQVNS